MNMTRVNPKYLPSDVTALHQVMFDPDNWPGKGPCVTLLIPECEMQIAIHNPAEPDAPHILINRPKKNKDVAGWIKNASKQAAQDKAALIFACDTAEQAENAARAAVEFLPNHKRRTTPPKNFPADYFQEQPPKVFREFRVGHFTCEMTYNLKAKPGDAFHVEWSPHVPVRGDLTASDLDQYRTGRHALLSEVGAALGGNILVLDA